MGIGVSVAIKPLLTALSRGTPGTRGGRASSSSNILAGGALPAATCDVLVCSIGPNLSDERVGITAELWAAGVRARCLYAADVSYEEQLSWAHAHRVAYLIVVKETTKASGLVRVKALARKAEIELERAELPRYFSALGRAEPVPYADGGRIHTGAEAGTYMEYPIGAGAAPKGGFSAMAAAAAGAAAAVAVSGGGCGGGGAAGSGKELGHGNAAAVGVAGGGGADDGGGGGAQVPVSMQGLTKGQRAKLRRAQQPESHHGRHK